ncbi:hypothetical protein POM88_026929 [Heracleum sosnowskyi]|uniref:Uncharacterized protein n=1 Tax=Heracleum sosnowskyi TaxID=360622 RepID=A0AAD8IA11_9APIA|nr:hypothetical protein POM88_026929 [Heracleum sosnowskyi]
MSSRMNMVVPENMWKIINLKHLCISNVDEEPILMENLQTLSLVCPSRSCENILARTRNLLKLGLCGPLSTKSGDFHCPDLDLLMHLETLKLSSFSWQCKKALFWEAKSVDIHMHLAVNHAFIVIEKQGKL